jgi:hypothetical protein
MTHVAGHIELDDLSFGVLKPYKMKEKNGKETDELEDEPVDFPILYAPNGFKQFVEGNIVGFHPWLVPWKNTLLVIGVHVVPWNTHVAAEKEIMKHPRIKSLFPRKKKLEQLNSKLSLKLLELEFNKINVSPGAKRVLRMSMDYMKSASFRMLYKDKRKIKSINKIVKSITDTATFKETGFGLARNIKKLI